MSTHTQTASMKDQICICESQKKSDDTKNVKSQYPKKKITIHVCPKGRAVQSSDAAPLEIVQLLQHQPCSETLLTPICD